MKGMDRFYAIILIFTFSFGLASFAVLYSDFSEEKNKNALLYQFGDFLGLPKDFVDNVMKNEQLTGAIHLVSVINDENTKGFVVENTGSIPLSGFSVSIGESLHEPYASPSILLPGDKSVILIDKNTWESAINIEKVSITTKQGISLTIFALGTK